MRHIIGYVMVGLVMVSCSSPETHVDEQEPTYSNEDIKDLVNEYKVLAEASGIFVADDELRSVKFGNIPDDSSSEAVAACFYTKERVPWSSRIVILKNAWESFDLCDRRLIMFHELGHCLSHKNHDPRGSDTLMSPSFIPNRTDNHNCEVVDRFFSGEPAQEENINVNMELTGSEVHL